LLMGQNQTLRSFLKFKLTIEDKDL
jgi:hypothetical protein